ncbi:acyl carrier protein [Streptomyces sp. HU2014]|uniref:Acyl carrier protein n=1 Tax=Streptomyces albireticuli TaxID=1940 RepID=A0A1Z2LD64_9ACTN|nr:MULTISPECIES: acyl carrier protein [Streptomyces]ARZ72215.1 acyl carrier protein [Streptomyces albireticuli]UQI45585.1 acyl carrier protein [Streptomyces sp. HU2014]
MADEVFEAVAACVVDVLQVPAGKVVREAVFTEDLGATSLTLVEVVMALEEAFGIDVPEPDVEAVRTVGDACDLVRRLS